MGSLNLDFVQGRGVSSYSNTSLLDNPPTKKEEDTKDDSYRLEFVFEKLKELLPQGVMIFGGVVGGCALSYLARRAFPFLAAGRLLATAGVIAINSLGGVAGGEVALAGLSFFLDDYASTWQRHKRGDEDVDTVEELVGAYAHQWFWSTFQSGAIGMAGRGVNIGAKALVASGGSKAVVGRGLQVIGSKVDWTEGQANTLAQLGYQIPRECVEEVSDEVASRIWWPLEYVLGAARGGKNVDRAVPVGRQGSSIADRNNSTPVAANNNDHYDDDTAGEDALLATGTDGRAIPMEIRGTQDSTDAKLPSVLPFALMMAAGDPPKKPGDGQVSVSAPPVFPAIDGSHATDAQVVASSGESPSVTYEQLQSTWAIQDAALRQLPPEDRLAWLEHFEPFSALERVGETDDWEFKPTQEQIDFWGGEENLLAVANATLNVYANGDFSEIELVNKASTRIEKLKIEAEREIYYAEVGITSHLQGDQFRDPASHVMTYYSVGPKPSNVTALLPEAIEYGTMGMGSFGPNTDVWAIDVPEGIENQVLGGGRGRQKIRDDEEFNPHAYGVRHIGVLRDGQLIFDEGADVVLFGNIGMGEVATTDYKTMWDYVAEHGDLPPSARREMHIPGGTVWAFPTEHVTGADHHPIYDSYADFSRPYVVGKAGDPPPEKSAQFAHIVLDHNSPGALRHEFPAGRQVYVYDERGQTSMVEVRGWAPDPDHPGRGRVQTNIPGQLLNPTLPSEWNHGPARYALWDPDQLRTWQERAKEEITSGTIILMPSPPSKALLATEFPEGRKMYVEFFGKRVLAEVWSINDDGTIHMAIVPNRLGDTMETGDFTPEDLRGWNPPDPTEVERNAGNVSGTAAEMGMGNPADVRVDMVNPDHFTAYHDQMTADELEALMIQARDQQGSLDYADTPWEFPPEQEVFLDRAIPEVLQRKVEKARASGNTQVNLIIKSIGIGDVFTDSPGELAQMLERIFDEIADLNAPDIHFNIIVVGFDVSFLNLRRSQRQIEKEARILTGAHHPEGQVSVEIDMNYGDLTDSTSREVMAGYGPSDLTLWRYTWIAADPEIFDPENRPAYTTAPLSSDDAYHFIDALRAGTSGALLISDTIGTEKVGVMEVRK